MILLRHRTWGGCGTKPFCAPGEFKTIWADPSKASAWISTERDINGYLPEKDERERRAFSGG